MFQNAGCLLTSALKTNSHLEVDRCEILNFGPHLLFCCSLKAYVDCKRHHQQVWVILGVGCSRRFILQSFCLVRVAVWGKISLSLACASQWSEGMLSSIQSVHDCHWVMEEKSFYSVDIIFISYSCVIACECDSFYSELINKLECRSFLALSKECKSTVSFFN